MPENPGRGLSPRAMLENFDRALSHPDEEDIWRLTELALGE